MISTNLTKHLAELSKLTFTDRELENITAQMNGIITLMDKVKDFSEEENAYVQNSTSYESLRNDTALNSYETEKILANSKAVKNNSFAVPKIV